MCDELNKFNYFKIKPSFFPRKIETFKKFEKKAKSDVVHS